MFADPNPYLLDLYRLFVTFFINKTTEKFYVISILVFEEKVSTSSQGPCGDRPVLNHAVTSTQTKARERFASGIHLGFRQRLTFSFKSICRGQSHEG